MIPATSATSHAPATDNKPAERATLPSGSTPCSVPIFERSRDMRSIFAPSIEIRARAMSPELSSVALSESLVTLVRLDLADGGQDAHLNRPGPSRP
jgi:hypothetical protein